MSEEINQISDIPEVSKNQKMVTLRISTELHNQLKTASTLSGKSMNKFLEDIARASAIYIINKAEATKAEVAKTETAG